MKFFRSNLSPAAVILIVLAGGCLIVVLLPILLLFWLLHLLFPIFPSRGRSSFVRIFPNGRVQQHDRRPETEDAPREAESSPGAGDSVQDIECEVISAKTVDENGNEIR